MKILSFLERIPHSLKIALLIVFITKIFVFSLGFAVTYWNEGPSSPVSIITSQFNRWDSSHYINIAKNWYVNESEQRLRIVFFPLYPILIRVTTFNLKYIDLSALLVSNVSSILAFIYLFKLVKLDFNDDTAIKAVLYLSIFPTAYFLSAIYTEGLFFALVIASFYYARVAKWPLAGFLSLLAALTRLAGLLLLPALIVEYVHQKGWKLKNIDFNFVWPNLTLAGFLIYLGINYQVTGNLFTFIEIERTHWHHTIEPLSGLEGAWYSATNATFPHNITIGSAPIIFATLGLLAIIAGFLLRFRISYNVYMLFTWTLSVSTGWWISVPRYVMAMFPMFIIFGFLAHKRIINYAIIITFSAALCFFTVLFSLRQWAF